MPSAFYYMYISFPATDDAEVDVKLLINFRLVCVEICHFWWQRDRLGGLSSETDNDKDLAKGGSDSTSRTK